MGGAKTFGASSRCILRPCVVSFAIISWQEYNNEKIKIAILYDDKHVIVTSNVIDNSAPAPSGKDDNGSLVDSRHDAIGFYSH